jgi:fibronectin type 3 domain-containing protein
MNELANRRSRWVVALGVLAAMGVGGCRQTLTADSDSDPETEMHVAAIGEGFSSAAIGSPSPAGSWSVASGVHTVIVGGTDIWTTADQFRFVYETLPGNGTITAKVDSLTNSNNFAKAGVMIRETLAANAKNVTLVLTPVAANGYRLQSRTAAGGTSTTLVTGGSAAGTGWVRLARVGNVFTASYSANGTSWTQLGTTTLSMTTNVFIGLAATSHATGTSTTAKFSNVSATGPTPPTPPAAPTNLQATAGNAQVSLTWSAAAGATSYTVKRRTLATDPFVAVQSGLTSPSFTNTGLSNGTTYTYVVAAVNAAGSSPDSTSVQATPQPPPPPSAPSSLVATAGNNQVSLGWSASAGATSYNVKRSTTAGSGHDAIASNVLGTSFTDSTAVNGTTYYYLVTASNGSGESGPSNEAQATPAPPPIPNPPTGLAATAGNNQVSLTWSASAGATSYSAKRGTSSGGPYTPISGALAGTSFTDGTAVNGTPYYYVVTASNGTGESGNSNQVQATPSAPPAPTFASAAIPSNLSPAGSWSESAGTHTVNGAGADIYGTADAFRFAYQTVSGDVTVTARLQSLQNRNTWTKAVVMIREDLTAGAKNVAAVVSPTASNNYRMQVRSATGGSTSSTNPGVASTIPSWLRVERVGNSFSTYRSTNGTSWTLIGTQTVTMNATTRVGIGVTSHVTGTLAAGVFTNVTVTTPAPPQAPAGVAATPGNKQVHITWAATAGASSYTVKRSSTSGSGYVVVQAGISSDSLSYTNNNLVNGQTYYFVVSASNPSGTSGDSSEVSGTPLLLRPTVRTVNPADGATAVSPRTSVSLDLIMPNVGGGVDAATLTSSTVFLRKASDQSLVTATRNTSGGGDVVVLTPVGDLAPFTAYEFFLTDGLQDLTGAPFVPFASTFTTGAALPPPTGNVAFTKVTLSGTTGRKWTSVTVGPDNKLYAATVLGEIVRFPMNADGTLGTAQVINTITSNNGGARAIIGLTFDPAATSSNLILWVTHGGSALKEAPDWTGKLSRLSGTNLTTYQDYVTNFPRSIKDHMTNSIAFKTGEPTNVYIVQGSMNAMGAPDNAWGQRAEHLMAAAILKVDLTKITTPPLNIQTNDANPTGSGYNPFAANAPVTIYAAGVRNAYDLLWHTNGNLYSATNGSAAGGSTPATPSSLPSACTRRIDGTPYTGPQVPGITNNPIAEEDYLYKVVPNGYYGHPNPSRCEWVLNGGNPTSSVDNTEVTAYPVGTQKDRNWRGNVFNFGAHISPNGMLEWKSNVLPQLKTKLLIIRYSGGDDIIFLTVDPTTGNITDSQTGVTGASGFNDPLDITHNVATGHVYVTEHAGEKITLLRPNP